MPDKTTTASQTLHDLFPKGRFSPPATEADIIKVETKLNITIPDSLKRLFLECDGFQEDKTGACFLYKLHENNPGGSIVEMNNIYWNDYPPSIDLKPFLFFGSSMSDQSWAIRIAPPHDIIVYHHHMEDTYRSAGNDILSVYLDEYQKDYESTIYCGHHEMSKSESNQTYFAEAEIDFFPSNETDTVTVSLDKCACFKRNDDGKNEEIKNLDWLKAAQDGINRAAKRFSEKTDISGQLFITLLQGDKSTTLDTIECTSTIAGLKALFENVDYKISKQRPWTVLIKKGACTNPSKGI